MVTWTILAALAATLTGFSKTGLSGSGILIVPVMAMLFTAKQSVGVLLPMLLVGDLFAVLSYASSSTDEQGAVRILLDRRLPGIPF